MATIAEQYRMRDTDQPDGIRIIWSREEIHDDDASPMDYLYQDPDYKEEDDARLATWRSGEWHFIGIRAVATIEVTSNGTSIVHKLTSAGLWGIESDSGEDYLNEVYHDECQALMRDLRIIARADLGDDMLP